MNFAKQLFFLFLYDIMKSVIVYKGCGGDFTVYIVLDFEFNQPYDFNNNKVGKVVGNCRFEIIQIGAVKLDENFEIVGNFDELIKPVIYKRIHPQVEKLTNITDKMLRNKRKFPEVYADFRKFMGKDKEIVFGVWGGADMESLYRNLLFYKLCGEKMIFKYIDIQKLASKKLNYRNGAAIGLSTAVEMFDIKVNSPFHDAFCDADYTAKILRLMKDDDINIKIYNTAQVIEKKAKI